MDKKLYKEIYGTRIDTIQGELSYRLWHVGSYVQIYLNEKYMPIELEDIQALWNACQYGGEVKNVTVERGGNGVIAFVWQDENYHNNRAVVIASVNAIEKQLIPILKLALSDERQDVTRKMRKDNAAREAILKEEKKELEALEKQRRAKFVGRIHKA